MQIVGANSINHRTDKSFNLTEYYALKSVKLSDSYTVKFVTYNKKFCPSKPEEDAKNEDLCETDIFFCENIKIPTIKNDIHKLEAGSMGNKFSIFSQKPFDDINMRLIEDDKSSVYKFIIDRLTSDFSPYRHSYVAKETIIGDVRYIYYEMMDCDIMIYDNAFNKQKMHIILNECKITNYSTSTFNSNDTSTPYMYDISMSFNGMSYEYL